MAEVIPHPHVGEDEHGLEEVGDVQRLLQHPQAHGVEAVVETVFLTKMDRRLLIFVFVSFRFLFPFFLSSHESDFENDGNDKERDGLVDEIRELWNLVREGVQKSLDSRWHQEEGHRQKVDDHKAQVVESPASPSSHNLCFFLRLFLSLFFAL